MKKRILQLAGCVLTIFITLGLVQYAGHLLDPRGTAANLSTVRAFQKLEKNSQDVIVYGSSHAWKGCDTAWMSQKYGFNAYNYACNWQAIDTTWLFINDSLRTQQPKVICVDTYRVWKQKKNIDMDGEIYYTRELPDSEAKRAYLKKCFGTFLEHPERYVSYALPLIMFHENWSSINAENFRQEKTDGWIKRHGYNPSSECTPSVIEDYTSFPQESLSRGSLKRLDEITKLCKERGISLIYYTTPYAGSYKYWQAMEEYAAANDCVYLNLFEAMDEMQFDPSTDLRDEGHLNDSGARKVADYLGQYIQSNGLI